MTDSQQSDWDELDAIMSDDGDGSRGDSRTVVDLMPNPAQAAEPVLGTTVPDAPNAEKHVDGIVARFKSRRITSDAAQKELRLHFKERYRSVEHELGVAVDLRNRALDVRAEELLAGIESRHIQALDQIGVSNVDARHSALIKLHDNAITRVREVQQKDWPGFLIKKTIRQIMDLTERLSDQMMTQMRLSDDGGR
ncbi:MAG: hypothetical protein GKS06_13255 [Acidobacteria bacterium]|nr:hypothetical protein [Acidobacteriota bacterium]